jgi:hypothetical protein
MLLPAIVRVVNPAVVVVVCFPEVMKTELGRSVIVVVAVVGVVVVVVVVVVSNELGCIGIGKVVLLDHEENAEDPINENVGKVGCVVTVVVGAVVKVVNILETNAVLVVVAVVVVVVVFVVVNMKLELGKIGTTVVVCE